MMYVHHRDISAMIEEFLLNSPFREKERLFFMVC